MGADRVGHRSECQPAVISQQHTPLPCAAPSSYSPLSSRSEHKAAGWKTPIWDVYKTIVNEGNGAPVPFEEVERFAFYERAKKAFCVVSTG